MTEMCKTKNELSPSFMQEVFRENTTRYNLRNNNEFIQPRMRSVSNGTESVRVKGPQLWLTLPSTVRNSETLCQFKREIKGSVSSSIPCTCRLLVGLCLSPFSWAMKMATTKANQETTRARHAG